MQGISIGWGHTNRLAAALRGDKRNPLSRKGLGGLKDPTFANGTIAKLPSPPVIMSAARNLTYAAEAPSLTLRLAHWDFAIFLEACCLSLTVPSARTYTRPIFDGGFVHARFR